MMNNGGRGRHQAERKHQARQDLLAPPRSSTLSVRVLVRGAYLWREDIALAAA